MHYKVDICLYPYLLSVNSQISSIFVIAVDWNAHSNAVFDLEWMSREEKILTGSGDQTICLWDARTAQKLLTFKGHTSSVRSVVFRPHDDGKYMQICQIINEPRSEKTGLRSF